jgi:hypothetical protein
MKTNSILTAIVLTTTLATTAAIAQGTSTTPVATPATPAPSVVVNPTPPPNQVIYLPQLPSATALANAAAAQGVSVEQMNQTSTQITVVYKFSNGQTNTICYQLLSAAVAAPAVAGPAAVAAPGQTTVVYAAPAPAYQAYPTYYYDPYYYPWPWFAPVAVSLGFGFHGGYYHGGYYHGGWGHHGGGHGWR